MSVWTPEWRVKIQGVEYTNLTLSNLTISSGRTDIYQQPIAGYCRLQVKNNDLSNINFDINDGLTVEVKNDAGTWVVLFGGNITDMNVNVSFLEHRRVLQKGCKELSRSIQDVKSRSLNL